MIIIDDQFRWKVKSLLIDYLMDRVDPDGRPTCPEKSSCLSRRPFQAGTSLDFIVAAIPLLEACGSKRKELTRPNCRFETRPTSLFLLFLNIRDFL